MLPSLKGGSFFRKNIIMKNKIIPTIIIAICVMGIILAPRPQMIIIAQEDIKALSNFPWNDEVALKKNGFIEQEDGSFLLKYGENKEHSLSVYFGQGNCEAFNITITQQGKGSFSLPLWLLGNSPVVITGAGSYKNITFVFSEEINVFENDYPEIVEALKF